MSTSKKPQPFGMNAWMMCAMTPGTLGVNDAAHPDSPSWLIGDTPGPLGCRDHADPELNRPKLVDVHLRRGPLLAPEPDFSVVPQTTLDEYAPHLTEELKTNAIWACQKTGLNPGFLIAVLLTEKDIPRYYTCPAGTILRDVDCVANCPPNAPGVCSFAIGTDTYRDERARIEAAVPVAKDVKFAAVVGGAQANEKGNVVRNIHFETGKDAVLGVAVYLKYGEHMVRGLVPTFDAQPVAVQWGLVRLAMNPGIGKCKSRINKVNRGKDIFVSHLEIRGGHVVRNPDLADSMNTRLVAIALYLSQTTFGIEP